MDIDDTRPENRLFGTLGCDGALPLRFPSTKFPIHYLAGSKTLICLPQMRNGILNRGQSTWENTDTRLAHQAFYEPTINHPIAIHDLGGGSALNDFMDHLGNTGGN